MKQVLQIEQLTKTYKNGRGVNNISFSVQEGEIVGLLGPNGSGKTTIMKSVVGFHRYDSGKITVFGADPADGTAKVLEKTGCLIEQPALYEHMTAKRQLKMMARFYPEIGADTVENILKEVGLERYGNEKVRRFSLGMKQRLGIAMALLSHPDFVILDEPGNGLDIEASVELRKEIMNMAKKEGKAFLVSSHQADDLEKMCDRVIVIFEGALIDDVSVEAALRYSPSLEDFFLTRIKESKVGSGAGTGGAERC